MKGILDRNQRNNGFDVMSTNYNEQLQEEIKHVPEDSFKQGWQEVMQGDTQPIDSLWDGID